ncbi:hypothetical protein GCM10007901_23250 [Dyella acidisoli]|uniref:Uncharacterized protein n=1 Tax=Dyella acidisoli TaxID=1867834 RepID=A0ABQ5XNX5_9GAMM|nr:hypothetical protein GCM10007901_23250 [Dyella acidisoli]
MQAGDAPPACAVDYVASDHGRVIPSKVTGIPGARLTLYRIHPDNLKIGYLQNADAKADAAYLLTGDKVQQVETCDGYAFVRFDGPHRVSTGWVESDRLAPQGEPYQLTPPNTEALCQAAAEIMNHGGSFPAIPQRSLDKVFASKNGYSDYGQRGQAMTRLKVGDRVFASIDVNDGGSCSSTYQDIWSADLSQKLSPKTRQYDDPAYNLSEGRDETWVEILGKPVLLGNGPGSDVFYISTLDDGGNIHTACKGSLQPLTSKRLVSSSDNKVCAAITRGEEKQAAMGEPTGDSWITLSSPLKGLKRIGKSGNDVFVYEDGNPSTITYKALNSGSIDLNNDGKPVRIALVAYENSSGAGCGSGVHLEAPVLIDKDDHIDPSEPVNDAIFKRIGGPLYEQEAFPTGSMRAGFVIVAGKHYLETTWNSGEQQIWSLSDNKAMKLCSLQTLHYVVIPNDDVGTVN